MAGDWIVRTVGLSRKSEIVTIAREMGRSRWEVACLIEDFWEWAQAETVDGLLPRLTIADLVSLVGADEAFWSAVAAEKWLVVDAAGLRIPNFDRWLSNGAKSRLQKIQRQAKWRAGRKAADADVDAAASTEAPTRVENSREEKRSPQKPPKGRVGRRSRTKVDVADVTFPDALETPEARAALARWLEHKRANGKAYKRASSVEALLAEWAPAGSAAFVAAVNHSIGQNYQGVFPAKGGHTGNGKPSRWGPGQKYMPEFDRANGARK